MLPEDFHIHRAFQNETMEHFLAQYDFEIRPLASAITLSSKKTN